MIRVKKDDVTKYEKSVQMGVMLAVAQLHKQIVAYANSNCPSFPTPRMFSAEVDRQSHHHQRIQQHQSIAMGLPLLLLRFTGIKRKLEIDSCGCTLRAFLPWRDLHHY